MLSSFVKAARLRTLPLSISGIIVGCFLGHQDAVNAVIDTSGVAQSSILNSAVFWLAVITTIGFQVLSNFANDYGDGIKGTDAKRKGEQRMVASGEISPSQMKMAVIITAIVTLGVALALIYLSFGLAYLQYSLIFIGLGVAAIVAAIKYTVGSSPYGYSGFGDLFVFVFFGLLSVVGSYFLFTKSIEWTIFMPAFAIGMLSTAVLNLNNMRDREQDEKAGKRTLVVKIGAEFAKYYHYYLLAGAFLFAMAFILIQYRSPFQFMFALAFLPLCKHAYVVYRNTDNSLLDSQLKIVALSTFVFAILFSLGYVL